MHDGEGRASSWRPAQIDHFNEASGDSLRPRLLDLTASPRWADQLIAGRPYADRERLLATSDELVLGLDEGQVDAALAGHPRIGERGSEQSTREQAGMSQADASVQAAMAQGNAAYEERFGRIYLVAAAGRSAEELLALLHARLDNDPDTELDVVRGELARITRLRLSELLEDT
jgi:2-oxo-4-hydroxy-4-carboxy-5-ureidoimidazoline decarboxylase